MKPTITAIHYRNAQHIDTFDKQFFGAAEEHFGDGFKSFLESERWLFARQVPEPRDICIETVNNF